RSLDVQPAQYGQSHITITDPAYTSPPNEQRQKRIAAERQTLRKLRAQWRQLPTQTVPDLNAVLPAQGIASTPFGFRRYINGKLRSSHLGLDIAAPVGTPIHAAMAGQVQMIADRFYTGWTVVIDHGLGVQTLYAHLSQIQPRLVEGQYIEQGALIGAMGATGRATGSHLHWGLNLSGVAVDPAILLSPEERARIQLPSD
ncbi:MAG: M23 family metallopeptidase, partial [Gammaproteobacteria bacterium]